VKRNDIKQKILNWAKLHPDEPDSAFILESYAGFLQRKKEETKRWWLIVKLELEGAITLRQLVFLLVL